jgi:hypothetical protein
MINERECIFKHDDRCLGCVIRKHCTIVEREARGEEFEPWTPGERRELDKRYEGYYLEE